MQIRVGSLWLASGRNTETVDILEIDPDGCIKEFHNPSYQCRACIQDATVHANGL